MHIYIISSFLIFFSVYIILINNNNNKQINEHSEHTKTQIVRHYISIILYPFKIIYENNNNMNI
jgi:hypothetical protein